MTEEPNNRFYSAPGLLGLWTGVLLPPTVWALQMQINYVLVRKACTQGSSLALYVVSIVALAAAVAAALIALTNWRRSGPTWPSGAADLFTRSRFLAVLGLLMSAMFFLVILAQGIATVVFPPCQL
jgi:hypothetical protein